ncbi:MAG: serine/threonine protein kinase [bacterium]|nr:serine/threonine protein kinase [bacterium]
MTGQEAETDKLARLLDEYFAAECAGDPLDLANFERRAGEQAHEFRQVVDLADKLGELGQLMDPDAPVLETSQPDQVGRFDIHGILGSGGFSDVYFAWDPELARPVALKCLKALTPESNARAVAEGRILGQLRHPNVVEVYEMDEAGGRVYVAMALAPGPNLHSVLAAMRGEEAAAGGAIAAESAQLATELKSIGARCRLVAKLARALAYCHEQDVIHRDIKPSNIILEGPAAPTLVDFGLAHTESDGVDSHVTEQFVGSLLYLAPEQIESERTGKRRASDQWSLGVLLYELLTLRNPYDRERPLDTRLAITGPPPPPPSKLERAVPRDLDRICLHVLTRSPEARYPSMGAFADDLEAFLEHRAISLREPSLARLVASTLRRYRLRIAAVVGAALLPWALNGYSQWMGLRTKLASLEVAARQSEGPNWQETFTQFKATEVRVGDFDAGIFGHILPLMSEIDRLREAARERFNRDLTDAFEKVLEEPLRQRQMHVALTTFADWYPNLARAEDVFPHRHSYSMASLDVTGGQLWQFVAAGSTRGSGQIQLASRNPQDGLQPGYYRYASGGLETEFHVFLGQVIRPVKLRSVPPKIREGCVPLSSDYLILEEPVTRADFLSVVGDSLRGPTISDGIEAHVPWCFAQEFAQRVGGRLPTPKERLEAQSVVKSSSSMQAEWTSLPSWHGQPFALALLEERMDVPLSVDSFVAHPIDGFVDADHGIQFRVVIPAQ